MSTFNDKYGYSEGAKNEGITPEQWQEMMEEQEEMFKNIFGGE